MGQSYATYHFTHQEFYLLYSQSLHGDVSLFVQNSRSLLTWLAVFMVWLLLCNVLLR